MYFIMYFVCMYNIVTYEFLTFFFQETSYEYAKLFFASINIFLN